MSCAILFLCTVVLCGTIGASHCNKQNDVKRAAELDLPPEQFLRMLSDESNIRGNTVTKASWNYETNINSQTRETMIAAQEDYAEYVKNRWKRIQNWQEKRTMPLDQMTKRELDNYAVLDPSALPADKFARFAEVKTTMEEIYSTAKICSYSDQGDCSLSLDPEISELMRSSRNYDELTHVWTKWRDASGMKIRPYFEEYVQLLNEAAVLNGFETAADMWMHKYESPTFEADVTELNANLQPLYMQLHAYVRRKLREVYGENVIPIGGAIPAHLLGNMWAQTWVNLFDIVVPYPDRNPIDVTAALVEQGYTPTLMFETADDFFTSMNLTSVPQSFWDNSVLEKPKDRNVVCHPSAWDFFLDSDVRIKQCAQVNQEDFFTIHHEMGHIQYYLQYEDQPYSFKDGANPGFHEAIGDVLSLSVSTPKHLHNIGLINAETSTTDSERDINVLMKAALSKIAFLPFGYLIDKWRWDVFRGNIDSSNYTCSWWNERLKLQGIKPPVQRSEDDFDPGAKFHVASGNSYIEYFVSFITQFQMYKSLCSIAGETPTNQLHNCDIYNSVTAGNALGNLLRVGSSQHWSKTLEELTGATEISPLDLKEYFSPLQRWLEADNAAHNETVGWDAVHDYCTAAVPNKEKSGFENQNQQTIIE